MEYIRHYPTIDRPSKAAINFGARCEAAKKVMERQAKSYGDRAYKPMYYVPTQNLMLFHDLLFYYATKHGVQLNIGDYEYTADEQAIEQIAIKKQQYKYIAGDTLPREVIAIESHIVGRNFDYLDGKYTNIIVTIAEYHGTFYVMNQNHKVWGFRQEDCKFIGTNIYEGIVIHRSKNLDEVRGWITQFVQNNA